MKIITELVQFNADPPAPFTEVLAATVARYPQVIRWGVVAAEGRHVWLEISTITGASTNRAVQPPCSAAFHPRQGREFVAAMIVPAGVGAAVGGYIGDASPTARAIEQVVDKLIVNPNAVNGGSFYGGGDRSMYVDGLTLDRFMAGECALADEPPTRIGVLVDKVPAEKMSTVLNTLNGFRAVFGIDIVGYAVCQEKVRSTVSRSPYGHFLGHVENLDIVLDGAMALAGQGAQALAVVTDIDGYTQADVQSHYAGTAVNPVGAIEALISRAVTWQTGLPCAHAPVYSHGLGVAPGWVDPRAAAEVASLSGLPCLLHGLSRARAATACGGYSCGDLRAVIVPGNCVGGVPALAAAQRGIPVIAVQANKCHVGVSASDLGLAGVQVVGTYADAIALLCCMKAGVDWQVFNGNFSELARVQPAQ